MHVTAWNHTGISAPGRCLGMGVNCHAGSVGLKLVYTVLYLYNMYTYVSNQVRVYIYTVTTFKYTDF